MNAGPLLVYLIERLVRLVRGNQNTILQKLVGHPSRVLGTYPLTAHMGAPSHSPSPLRVTAITLTVSTQMIQS